MPEQGTQSEVEEREEFIKAFCEIAGFQGRFAYCLMSIYAVNPALFEYFTSVDLYPFLLWNMIYGIAVMIMSRPSLKPLVPVHRFTFSLLGSLAFNYSSLQFFHWLAANLEGMPILRTLLGYLSGRVMIVHLIAFLYHIDTRCTDVSNRARRLSAFEAMYL
ncbi:uncharacterized protein LOC109544840 [Dendroctonus ponderosae]|uniref:Very-long-chain 3-oxoacyl-CoA synthase n=1 Tax=Dendroctonus ponderosae TaxID=77166 RepID=A0AAR5QC21_DENPD|nr:uncharacterized protein LOC109544840 [Dendroctonus ponderosae]